MTRTHIRQILLYLVSAVFLTEAIFALLDPHGAAARVGYQIAGPDGLSEYRAVYLGMFGALGVATLVAARRVREPLLADVICAAIVAEAAARFVGIGLDGVPGTVHVVNIAMESFPIVILLLRPDEAASFTAGRAGDTPL
jgi:hypothetical protein